METCSEFTRPHHRRVEAVLRMLNAGRLHDLQCYFGGGTAISLQLGEYRESIDIDFLCKSRGFHEIHRGVYLEGVRFLFSRAPRLASETRRGRDAIRCAIDLEDGGKPIKFEIIQEGYLQSLEAGDPVCGVTCLSKADSIACKLMANADRGLDPAHQFRDFIDAAVASNAWKGEAPGGFEKAISAYGNDGSILTAVEKVRSKLDTATLTAAGMALSIHPQKIAFIEEIISRGEPSPLPARANP